MHEQRITQRILDYWTSLKGDRPYPSERDIDPEAIPDLWDHMFLMHTRSANSRSGFRYAYMGGALIRAYGENLAGLDVYDALLNTSRDTIIEDVVKTIHTRAPLVQEAEFDNVHHVRIKYRRILCPLGPTPETIDYLIGGMRWQAV